MKISKEAAQSLKFKSSKNFFLTHLEIKIILSTFSNKKILSLIVFDPFIDENRQGIKIACLEEIALNKPVVWNYKGISYYPHIISTKKRMLTSFHDANYLTTAPKY